MQTAPQQEATHSASISSAHTASLLTSLSTHRSLRPTESSVWRGAPSIVLLRGPQSKYRSGFSKSREQSFWPANTCLASNESRGTIRSGILGGDLRGGSNIEKAPRDQRGSPSAELFQLDNKCVQLICLPHFSKPSVCRSLYV